MSNKILRANEASITPTESPAYDKAPSVEILDLGLSIAGCSSNRDELWEGDTLILKTITGDAEIALKVTYIGPIRETTKWKKIREYNYKIDE